MELEKIFELTVGQLRELIAYRDADELIYDLWAEVTELDLEVIGYNDDSRDASEYEPYDDEEDDWDEDEDDSDYDDDYEDEECEDDEEEVESYWDDWSKELEDPAQEELAQKIAQDIRLGHYSIATVRPLYSEEVINRISDLI